MVKVIDPMKEPGGLPPLRDAMKAAGMKPPGPRPKTSYRAAKENAQKDDPYGRDPALMADFRNFLTVVWEHVGRGWSTGCLPSAVQLSLAYWLQHGPERQIILGFRGMAKSWITGAYALWCLYCNPQIKILIVSASLDRSVQTVQWMLALIREMPDLQWLLPRDDQRSSMTKGFDVAPATPAQSPSVRPAGITGQMAGSRADLIIPDDVEIPSNSMTTLMRERISEAVKEFDAIITPGGAIRFLGTPQVDDSVYIKLQKRGYTCRIWPAEYPNVDMQIRYGDRLAPFVLNRVQKDPTLAGHSVWKERFSDDDLAKRRLSYGRSGYSLQFLLDTSISDADRYPLKLRDLIVDPCDIINGPDVISWGNDQKLIHNNLPVMGFDGDHYYGPANRGQTVSKYNTITAWLDPSGRGGDETGLAIVAELHGRLFLLHIAGWRDGYAPSTLQAIARALVQFNVNKVWIEDNFGDGMFLALVTPYIIKAWKDANSARPESRHGGTDIEGIRSPRVQKELRILSVLEPAMQQHRLVVSTSVIEHDYRSIQAYADLVGSDAIHQYSLMHQMSHITREKDCLLHDDRIESLAGAISTFAEILGINPWESAAQKEEERMEAELERLFAETDEIGQYTQAGVRRWDRTKHPIRPN